MTQDTTIKTNRVEVIRFVSASGAQNHGIVLQRDGSEWVEAFFDEFVRQDATIKARIGWVSVCDPVGASRYEFGSWRIQWQNDDLRRLAVNGVPENYRDTMWYRRMISARNV